MAFESKLGCFGSGTDVKFANFGTLQNVNPGHKRKKRSS